MMPPASVSGIYLAHSAAGCFSPGKITHEQVVDYAARKGMSVEEVDRWLVTHLAEEQPTPA